MSLRPRDPNNVARLNRATGRMAPGGRRWSESPIPRAAIQRPKRQGVESGPLFWWMFDDASGNLTEVNGGPSFVPTGTGTYQQSPLATGSTYSYSFYSGGSYDVPETGATSVGLDPTGDIVIDVWFQGIFEDSTSSTATLVQVSEQSLTGSLCIKAKNASPDELLFTGGTSGTTTLSSVARASVPDPAHIVWTVNPSAGTSTVVLNGTTVATDTGLTIAWTGDPFYLIVGPGDWTASAIDELKIYGTAA